MTTAIKFYEIFSEVYTLSDREYYLSVAVEWLNTNVGERSKDWWMNRLPCPSSDLDINFLEEHDATAFKLRFQNYKP